jgi:hypothetical protein
MSDRQEWARKTLAKLAVEISAWPRWKNNKVFQKALIDIRDDPEVEKIVAQFGLKIPLTQRFMNDRPRSFRDPIEEAIGRMMSTTAIAMADSDWQPVPSRMVIRKQEAYERVRARVKAAVLPHYTREAHLQRLDFFQAIEVSPSDPRVERRRPTRKDHDGGAEDYDHARAVLVAAKQAGRWLFGKAGDRVANVFVTAAAGGTGLVFSQDDQRVRHKR